MSKLRLSVSTLDTRSILCSKILSSVFWPLNFCCTYKQGSGSSISSSQWPERFMFLLPSVPPLEIRFEPVTLLTRSSAHVGSHTGFSMLSLASAWSHEDSWGTRTSPRSFRAVPNSKPEHTHTHTNHAEAKGHCALTYPTYRLDLWANLLLLVG